MPSLIDLRRRDPRGQEHAADHQGDEDGRRVEAAPRAGADHERAAVRRADAARARRASRRASIRRSIRCSTAREPRADSRTLVIVVTGDKGLCGSFNTNIIKAGGSFIARAAPQPCTLGLVGRKGRDFFGRRGFDVLFEQIGIFQKLRFDDAQAIAQTAIDAFTRRRGRSRDARLQRVQVGDDAAGRRRAAAADRARRRRGADARAGAPAASAPGRLPLRAVAAGDLQPAAAALRRGAGLSRAARVERRVLRRADDGDGHGDEELGGHDRAA